jgi:hypothetical protein
MDYLITSGIADARDAPFSNFSPLFFKSIHLPLTEETVVEG